MSHDKISYPLCFNAWEKFLCWLFPRSYDPWFEAFLYPSVVTLTFDDSKKTVNTDGETYYADSAVTSEGKHSFL